MDFGKDLRRRFGRIHGVDALASDASVLELLPLTILRNEARAAEAAVEAAAVKEKSRRRLDQALILREIGRRTGEVETLVKSASAAVRAAQEAEGDMSAFAAARVEQAQSALMTAELFGLEDVADGAEAWFGPAADGFAAHPALRARVAAVTARFKARKALAAGDLDQAVEAAAAYDIAVERLDAQVKVTGLGQAEAAAVRCERAEILIAFGARLKERKLLEQAQADMRQLAARVDPEHLPLSWARIMALRGAALAMLGDLDGDAQAISKGVEALNAASDTIIAEHSPLDYARACHGLGLARQALGEAVDDEDLFDEAVIDFDRGLTVLQAHPALRLRPIAAYDRAACMARRAERLGDPIALDRAEEAFKAELTARRPDADPLAWAVLQVALARLYESRTALTGERVPQGYVAVALNEALEVFAERGLKSLAEIAREALERMRETAV